MESENKPSWIKSAGKRIIVVTALIAVVTAFWVVLLIHTDLPTWVMAGIALVSILLLSIATAWAAMAVPKRTQRDGKDPAK